MTFPILSSFDMTERNKTRKKTPSRYSKGKKNPKTVLKAGYTKSSHISDADRGSIELSNNMLNTLCTWSECLAAYHASTGTSNENQYGGVRISPGSLLSHRKNYEQGLKDAVLDSAGGAGDCPSSSWCVNRTVSLAKNCKREWSLSSKDHPPTAQGCCPSASSQETFHSPKRTSQHPGEEYVSNIKQSLNILQELCITPISPLVPTREKLLTCTSSLSISTFLKMVNQNSGMPLGFSSSAVAASFSAITTLFFISPYKTFKIQVTETHIYTQLKVLLKDIIWGSITHFLFLLYVSKPCNWKRHSWHYVHV